MKGIFVLLTTMALINPSAAQWSTSSPNIYNTNTGYVGIGTGSAPTSQLDIRRDETTPTIAKVRNLSSGPSAAARFDLETYSANSYVRTGLYYNLGSPYFHFYVGSAVQSVYFDGPEFIWRNTAGTNTWIKITQAGNVGIGTTTTGSHKLAVEGTIGARGITVTSVNPWPDYVFKPGYSLRTLADIESYIQVHQHLPGIPSAAEINESGGIELAEMNRKLLEKVEELTLYIIQVNKRLDYFEKQIKRK